MLSKGPVMGKRSHLIHEFLINTYMSRDVEYKTECFMLVLQNAINQATAS